MPRNWKLLSEAVPSEHLQHFINNERFGFACVHFASAAFDRELLRRLEDHLTEAGRGPAGSHASGSGTGRDGTSRGAARRPSWARDDEAREECAGPYSVVVVDGDPFEFEKLKDRIEQVWKDGVRVV